MLAVSNETIKAWGFARRSSYPPRLASTSKKGGAGQIRIFALANPLLQGMVRPIQDWLMTILSLIQSSVTSNTD